MLLDKLIEIYNPSNYPALTDKWKDTILDDLAEKLIDIYNVKNTIFNEIVRNSIKEQMKCDMDLFLKHYNNWNKEHREILVDKLKQKIK